MNYEVVKFRHGETNHESSQIWTNMVSVAKSSLLLYDPGSNDYCTVQL